MSSTFSATDIDGTLVGCPKGLAAFATFRDERPELLYGVATGRSLHAALDILETEGAPLPAVMIVAVGSEVYWRDECGIRYRQDEAWARHIGIGWQRKAVDALVMRQPGFVRQPALEQRRHKLAYFVDPAEGEAHVALLRETLRDAGLRCSVIHSHGKFVDVLPERANKGRAVEFVARTAGISLSDVVAAGDSGNDIDMLRAIGNAVIVANHRDGITDRHDLRHAYVARNACAGGIVEGLKHFERAMAHG